jgi:hypothetical protein
MLNYEEAKAIRNSIEVMISSHCDGMVNDNGVAPVYNDVYKEIFSRFSDIASPNEITYLVRDIVSSHMREPTSPIFKYVCTYGIGADFITSHIQCMSRDEYIDFCVNNIDYTSDVYGISMSEYALSILRDAINMSNIDLNGGYVSYIEHIYGRKNTEIEHVFLTMQTLFNIVSQTSSFYNRDESELFMIVDNIVDRFRDMGRVDMCIGSNFSDITPELGIELITRIIVSVCMYGDVLIHDNEGVSKLLQEIGVSDKIQLTLPNYISSFSDILQIISAFMYSYIDACEANQGLYGGTSNKESIMAEGFNIVIDVMYALLTLLTDIIDGIDLNYDYTNAHYDDNREVMREVYGCLYDKVISYGARRWQSNVS